MKMPLFLLSAAALLALGVAAAALVSSHAPVPGPDGGHRLAELWTRYDEAARKDQPKTQESLLNEILDRASEQRYHWDFFDALTRLEQVVSRRNWKLRDSASRSVSARLAAYDEPVVSLGWALRYGTRGDALTALARKGEKTLRTGRNKPFWSLSSAVSSAMNGCLPDYLSSDYEWALWSAALTTSGRSGLLGSQAMKELRALLSGAFLGDAYLDYLLASRTVGDAQRRKELRTLEAAHRTDAIGFLCRQDLLLARKDSLDRSKGRASEYRALDADCARFEKERAGFHGAGKDIVAGCDRVSVLVSELHSTSLRLLHQGDSVRILLRNLKDAVLTVTPDNAPDVLYRKKIQNAQASFYVWDTLTVPLPRLDDGTYCVTAKNGENSDQRRIALYSLSLSVRREAGGWGVYVADSRSGEPLRSADLLLQKNGKQVASMRNASLGAVYTPLPASLAGKLSKRSPMTLQAVVRDGKTVRRSRTVYFSEPEYYSEPRSVRQDARIFLDRKAFRPGDTLFYKGIFFGGDFIDSLRVVPEGKAVQVRLTDAEGKELATDELKTNGFGSVSGSFVLPRDARNGRFSISMRCGDMSRQESFRVDEFEIPGFEILPDAVEKLWLPGDEVQLGGQVRRLDGHPMSSATVHYRVLCSRDVLAEGDVTPDADGRYALSFLSRDSEYQYIEVAYRVTDATGETQERTQFLFISARIHLDLSLEGSCARADLKVKGAWAQMVESRNPAFRFTVRSPQGGTMPLDVAYTLKNESGTVLDAGNVPSGTVRLFPLPAGGLYTLEASAQLTDRSGQLRTARSEVTFLSHTPEDRVLDAPVEYLVLPEKEEVSPGEALKLKLGSATAPLWAVVEVFGTKRELLESRAVHLDGGRGGSGSLTSLSVPYREKWPDAVRLRVFWFRGGDVHSVDRIVRRSRPKLEMPLSFSRFEDKTFPGTRYTFRVRTDAGAELLAAIFDKGLDAIAPNVWQTVRREEVPVAYVVSSDQPGTLGTVSEERYYGMNTSRYLSASGGRMLSKAVVEDGAMPMMASAAVEESAVVERNAVTQDADQEAAASEVPVREDFSASLAFLPHLRPDASGEAELSFTTSGKLSTYYVSLFSHDRIMRNAVLRQEMVVSLPVRVAVNPPEYLYRKDRFTLDVSLSCTEEKAVSGTLRVYRYAGGSHEGTPLDVQSRPVRVPGGDSVAEAFEIELPADADTLGLKVVFVADAASGRAAFSDAVFVPVPLYDDVQTLTESHSAVLLAGADWEALVRRLRAAFVNVSGADVPVKEISLVDRIRERIPDRAEPAGRDVLSLSEAWYVRAVAKSLGEDPLTEVPTEELKEKVLACQNADGGFGWFEGMPSSPVITAVLLERFRKLAARGEESLSEEVTNKAVKFLDDNQFDYDRPYWCGGLGRWQYLYIRALYAEVPFSVKQAGPGSLFRKRMAEFRKETAAYLAPKYDRNLPSLSAKVRRIRTLERLCASSQGLALAKAWGVTLGTGGKLTRSLEEDMESLVQYAVNHRDGGVYYPNLVMPWRGLLEDEAYAHAMVCDLLDAYAEGSFGGGAAASKARRDEALRIADGIRIWLMLQEETQQWDALPSFVDAVHSVLEGSDAVLQTRILVLSKRFTKPFRQVKAAGNGFRVERSFYRQESAGGKAVWKVLSPGTVLRKGDRIRAEYKVWNQENRSFVCLRAPREAAFRPVEQLSGPCGGFRSLRTSSGWTFSPRGYRNVKSARTEWYFDTFPEEHSTLQEEFFVTRPGVFAAPVTEVESMYAPHYRANAAFGGIVQVK